MANRKMKTLNMMNTKIEKGTYDEARKLIAAKLLLDTADLALHDIIALVDASIEDERMGDIDLMDVLDASIPEEDRPHVDWLIEFLTGPYPTRNRWYRDEATNELRRH